MTTADMLNAVRDVARYADDPEAHLCSSSLGSGKEDPLVLEKHKGSWDDVLQRCPGQATTRTRIFIVFPIHRMPA